MLDSQQLDAWRLRQIIVLNYTVLDSPSSGSLGLY